MVYYLSNARPMAADTVALIQDSFRNSRQIFDNY